MLKRLAVIAAFFAFIPISYAGDVKEWTFLVFLNGNNNLDSYGDMNMGEMKELGSSDKVNVVVQWASLSRKDVRRVYVEKGTFTLIKDMGEVDMGDYKNLIDFITWGATAYPAKHYFVDVWDHGSGWHRLRADELVRDISYDELSGHRITTLQLGQAMNEAAAAISHRIDIYGSDACLMAMPEVASEMSDSVDYFVGSEETEPAAGWPYQTLLREWYASDMTPATVSKILTAEYVKSYQNGVHGSSEVVFSAFDLSKMPLVTSAMKDLGVALAALEPLGLSKVRSAIGQVQTFYYSDYGDIVNLVTLLQAAGIGGLKEDTLRAAKNAFDQFVIANAATSSYHGANGASLWIPNSSSTLSTYWDRYSQLKFQNQTHWADALKVILN